MDIKSPSSEPAKSYENSNTEKTKTEKAEKQEVAQKPNDKPKPKNQIERPKINIRKEPKNKIQREKIDLHTPARNKIERPKIDIQKEPKNKIQREKIDLQTPARNKIERPKIDLHKKPRNKIQREKIDLRTPAKNKIERSPTNEPKNIIEPKVNNSRNLSSINTMVQKECGRCHETKSINEFEMYKRNNVANQYRERYCRPCRQEYKQVRALTNKNNILRNIYGGKYGDKCPGCDTNVAKLPAFDFHHPIKELKTGIMNFHGNWEKTLKRLENEKVIPSCRNCHLKEQPKFYKKYKELIEHKNEFESSLVGIESKLYKQIYKQYPGIGHKEGHQIKSWMSKRIVVERLYNGGCIGCSQKDLGTLQFHHRDVNKKTFQKYDKLRYTTLEKIEKTLIKDNAVCLCGNCHRMITSKYYEKNHQEIVGIKYSQEVKKIFKDLKKSIKNYEFPANILKQYPNIKTEKIEIGGRKPNFFELKPNEKRIKKEIMAYDWRTISQNWKLPSGEVLDPTKESSLINPLYKHKNWLKTVYSNINWNLSDTKIARLTNTSNTTINYWRNKLQINVKNSNFENTKILFGESWKKYLFHISKLSREGKTVQTKTLAESVGVKPSITRANIRKLISKGLISINGEHKKRTVILTLKGEKELKKNKKE